LNLWGREEESVYTGQSYQLSVTGAGLVSSAAFLIFCKQQYLAKRSN